MITITLNDIRVGKDNFALLLNQPMNARAAYRVTRLAKALDAEYELFIDGQRKLIDKYGAHDDNGELIELENGAIKIQEDKIDECNRELQELVATEVEINADKIQMSDLENTNLTPNQLITLMPFIEE